jgi:hypothetical protein
LKDDNVAAYANLIWAACIASYMAGAAVVARQVPAGVVASLRTQPSATSYQLSAESDNLFDPDAATKIVLEKRLMHKFEFDKLDAVYKRYSGTVAWVDSENLVQAVYDRLVKAIATGGTVADWKASVNEAFQKSGFTHPMGGGAELAPWHLETIFQTNVLSAYGAANWDMLHHPDVQGLFPMYQIVGGRMAHTCAICDDLEGVKLPSNDDFWLTHWPPFHFRCAHSILALDQEKAAGVSASDKKGLPEPLEGFGSTHGATEHVAIGEELAQANRADIDHFLDKYLKGGRFAHG